MKKKPATKQKMYGQKAKSADGLMEAEKKSNIIIKDEMYKSSPSIEYLFGNFEM